MQPQDIYFKYFSRKQHILTPFIGVIYSRQKLDLLGSHGSVHETKAELRFTTRISGFVVQVCLGRKIKPRETHITSHIIMIIAFIDVYGANGCCFMFVHAVLGKTTLLDANFGIFKYQQVFINV